jgi:hypothetical protein
VPVDTGTPLPPFSAFCSGGASHAPIFPICWIENRWQYYGDFKDDLCCGSQNDALNICQLRARRPVVVTLAEKQNGPVAKKR